jgi:glutathione S-transferase
MRGTNLTLISHPLCPFVQRAAIVLLEKDVSFDRIDVDLAAKPDWFLALSPTGKVPLLKISQEDGSDAILFESMVICEYLEESQGGAGLYPVDALSRARQRGWIEFGTAALANAWQFLNATDRPTAEAKLGEGPYFQQRRLRHGRCGVRAPLPLFRDPRSNGIAADLRQPSPRLGVADGAGSPIERH